MGNILMLWDAEKGWFPYKYRHVSELEEEFKSRNIQIDPSVQIDIGTRISNGVTISYMTRIGWEVEIGENSNIGPMTVIWNAVKIGSNVKIGSHVELEGMVKVGSNATICKWSRIEYASKISANITVRKGSELIREEDIDETPSTLSISVGRDRLIYSGGDRIQIGDVVNPIAYWEGNIQEFGENNQYLPDEIDRYKKAISLVKEFSQI